MSRFAYLVLGWTALVLMLGVADALIVGYTGFVWPTVPLGLFAIASTLLLCLYAWNVRTIPAGYWTCVAFESRFRLGSCRWRLTCVDMADEDVVEIHGPCTLAAWPWRRFVFLWPRYPIERCDGSDGLSELQMRPVHVPFLISSRPFLWRENQRIPMRVQAAHVTAEFVLEIVRPRLRILSTLHLESCLQELASHLDTHRCTSLALCPKFAQTSALCNTAGLHLNPYILIGRIERIQMPDS